MRGLFGDLAGVHIYTIFLLASRSPGKGKENAR